jgi:quercetin dioxygenase-like cupin family protein
MESQKEWVRKLEKEGFSDIRVVPLPPHDDDKEHGHEQYQVDVVLSGQLTISDGNGAKTYLPGDRLDVPAGTVHNARGGPNGGEMIVGVKEVNK